MERDKTDASLGRKIHEYLVSYKVETPLVTREYEPTPHAKMDRISCSFRDIMEVMGLDLKNDSLQDTPARIAKMFVHELFYGLNYNNFPKCTVVENDMQYDEMVVGKNITVMSVCEHHWGSIDGIATVAYIPEKKIIGLSKMNRIVDFFSRRPQIQERLTEQVFHALRYILETNNIAVLIDAEHQCVRSRGVKDINSRTVTSRLGGLFKDKEYPAARTEFMNLATKE